MTNLHEKICARVSFSIKLQAEAFIFIKKRGSGAGAFLWILWNFQEHLFRWTSTNSCFCVFIHKYLCSFIIRNSKEYFNFFLTKKTVTNWRFTKRFLCKESESCIYQSPVLVKIVKSSKVLRIISTNTEPYSEPSQSSTMKNFVKTVWTAENRWKRFEFDYRSCHVKTDCFHIVSIVYRKH